MSAMGLGRFCVIVTHICVVSFKRVCFDRKGWKSQTYRAKFFFRNFSRNLKNFKDSVRVIEYCAKHAITCSENGMSSSSLSSGGSANSQQQQKKKQPSSSRLSFREEDRRIRKQEQWSPARVKKAGIYDDDDDDGGVYCLPSVSDCYCFVSYWTGGRFLRRLGNPARFLMSRFDWVFNGCHWAAWGLVCVGLSEFCSLLQSPKDYVPD